MNGDKSKLSTSKQEGSEQQAVCSCCSDSPVLIMYRQLRTELESTESTNRKLNDELIGNLLMEAALLVEMTSMKLSQAQRLQLQRD